MKEFIENIYVNKELQVVLFEEICAKYEITLIEIYLLLFLYEHEIECAKEFVNKLKIAKSHVSTSLRNLEEKGYIQGKYKGEDHRTIHLYLCDKAMEIVSEIEIVQKNYVSILQKGFSEEEKVVFHDFLSRLTENVHYYLKDCVKKEVKNESSA